MSELVDGLLKDAGWVQGRRRPLEKELNLLRSNGFRTGKRLEDFLGEFGGLTIRYIRNGREDAAVLDVGRACDWADPEWVTEYSERAGTPLSPVGYANHEHLILLMGEDGRFYCGFDDFLGYLGDSGREMIRRLATQEIEPIP